MKLHPFLYMYTSFFIQRVKLTFFITIDWILELKLLNNNPYRTPMTEYILFLNISSSIFEPHLSN